MGRIAYIKKRGTIWWFRRRHPVIVLSAQKNPDTSGDCTILTRRVQAKGHVAVSLHTACAREARTLAARLADHFERAWACFEAGTIAMTNEDDFEDMAIMLTQGFRIFTAKYRSSGIAGLAPGLRERAFAMLDAELREALGIEALPYADALTRVQIRPRIKYIAFHAPDPNEPMTDEEQMYEKMAAEAATNGQLEISDQSVLQAIDPTDIRLLDAEDDDAVSRLETLAEGFSHLLAQYLNQCEQNGTDPRLGMEGAEKIAENLYQAAQRLGFKDSPDARQAQAPIDIKKAYSNELFSSFAAGYLKKRCQGFTMKREDESPHAATGANFERTSLRNWQSSIRVFSEIAGDLPLSEIGKEEVIEFNTQIQKLPANFGKSSRDNRTARQVIDDLDESEPLALSALVERLRDEGKPSAEIEDAVASAREKRIAATTIKRHQTALQSIFDFALAQNMIASNPFKGRVLTEGEVKSWNRSAARVVRIGWGDAIYNLLNSEMFHSPLGDIGEPLFWAPLIALYSGLRLEEVCQLRIGDFAKENGIYFVAVQNEVGSQLLKSDNAMRRVPLHKALIDIGLLKLVSLRQQQGANRLFPGMPRSKSKGTLSANMSKRFGYYIRSRGIKEPGLDFHAFRTEFLVRLTRAKVPDHVRKGLMGHEQTDVTHANYFRAGETIEALKEYIDRIDIAYESVSPPFGGSMIAQCPPLRLVR